MKRPRRLIAIAGTGTSVGKTWVAQDLLRRWKMQGLRVAVRKPVQSFEASDAETDADGLAAASGEDRYSVCPSHRWYPKAMAPPMAANVLQRPPILLQDLLHEISWPEHTDVALVETAGGVRSPLAHDGDSLDLIRLLQPCRVLLITNAALGMLNAVRLSLDCLQQWPTQVFLNRFDPADALHRANLEWLLAHDGVAAVTTTDALARSALA